MADLRELVERARKGDRAAFADLVERHQGWAMGCALALLGDYQLAQDAVQDALVAAHASLATLENSAAFSAWFKSIVRHTCYHALRGARPELIPLDGAADLPSAEPEPDQVLEVDERRFELLSALATLPAAQRELVLLHYWREYSQREIAALLNLPATTVNNRLHAARQRLREEIAVMADTTSRAASTNAPAPVPTGTVVAVRGPVAEVKFNHNRLPPLRSWLGSSTGRGKRKPLLAVVQYLTDGAARAVAVSPGTALTPGLEVVDLGNRVAAPIDDQNAREAVLQITRLAHQSPSAGTRIETGIKTIDLFCPLVDGDVVGFAARPGLGQIVLYEELLYRVATRSGRLTLIAAIPAVQRSTSSFEDPYSIGSVATVYLPLRDMSVLPPGFLDPVDARVTLSLALARLGMWPSVDPSATSSAHLDPAVVGVEHVAVASRARDLLRRFPPEQESDGGTERRAGEDDVLAVRARRLRRFLTQPLYVAAPWIRWPAALVPIGDTLRGCRDILDGAYDNLPDEAFYMANTIEQVVERARMGPG